MAAAAARKWFGARALPFWVLAVVTLAELFLFVDFHRERWRKGIVPRGNPRLLTGEGFIIRSDGHGYYAWLRSLLVDGDWSFDNEFDDHNPLHDWVPTFRTERGLRGNQVSVGPALVWSLAVVPGHLGLQAWQHWRGAEETNGYEMPYQLLVGCTSVLVSLLGLWFLYGICRHFARPSRAALAVGLLTLGTTIVFYSAVEVTMAHGLGTVAVAGLAWYWLRTYGSERPGRWLLVGGLVGVAALMRWQLATFALLPGGECVFQYRRAWRSGDRSGKPVACLALATLGSVLGFLPQVIAWKAVFGSWVVTPVVTSHNWLCPSWGRVLTSTDRGLFYWTPLTLLALGGNLCRAWRRAGAETADPANQVRKETLFLLCSAFLLQVYVLASLWGEAVQLGVSFGLRHLTESVVVLGPGLALLLERARPRGFRILCTLGCVLVVWNLQLVGQFRYGLVPAAAGAEPGTLLANAVHLVTRKKLLLVGQVAAAPLLLWLLVVRPGKRDLPGFPRAAYNGHRS
jgi:hypothetical protein